MIEKRYFKKMWEEEYYIFDSQTISEKEFDEKVEYEDYQAFEDSMMGDEVVNRLNELHEENKTFRESLKELKTIGDYQEMRIKELDDENQFIKHVINEALSAERTEIGKSVLKQLKQQIEVR